MVLASNNLHLVITGSVGSQVATCDLVIDYAQPQRALLTKFTVQEVDQTPETSEPTEA